MIIKKTKAFPSLLKIFLIQKNKHKHNKSTEILNNWKIKYKILTKFQPQPMKNQKMGKILVGKRKGLIIICKTKQLKNKMSLNPHQELSDLYFTTLLQNLNNSKRQKIVKYYNRLKVDQNKTNKFLMKQNSFVIKTIK